MSISGHHLRIHSCILWSFLYYWAIETPDKKPRIWLHQSSLLLKKKFFLKWRPPVLHMSEFLEYINQLVPISVAEENKWYDNFLKLFPPRTAGETNVWTGTSIDEPSNQCLSVYVVTLTTAFLPGCWTGWNLKLAEFCRQVGIPKIETDVTVLGLSRDDLGGIQQENECLICVLHGGLSRKKRAGSGKESSSRQQSWRSSDHRYR